MTNKDSYNVGRDGANQTAAWPQFLNLNYHCGLRVKMNVCC